jgi:hypothetical protein
LLFLLQSVYSQSVFKAPFPSNQGINQKIPAMTRGVVIFSGGSAANNLVDVFREVTEDKKRPLSYVIPISDNGGSSSELIRVFGGPGNGISIPHATKTKPLN